jgi:hypothetical protein
VYFPKLMQRVSIGVGTALLALFFGQSSGLAATNSAADTSYAAVLAAVSASHDGDTVTIPQGTAIWPSQISLTNGITIFGAGTNSTFIRGSGMFIVDFQTTKPIRISGISFDCDYTQSAILLHGRDQYALGAPINAFRVDHCFFHGGYRTVQPAGWCYGLIDHCTFVDPRIGVGPVGDADYAWARPVEPGSTNCVCVEDCAFWFTSAVNTPPNGVTAWPQELVYHYLGTRSIVRFCTFDATSYTADSENFIDCHGNQNYHTGTTIDFRGTVLMECYSNVFRGFKSDRFMYLRGGTHFIYGNTMTNISTASSFPIVMTEEESWQTDFFFPLRTVWPAQDQITNSYFWANTYKADITTPYTTALNNNSDQIFIQEGRDYWNHPPLSTNVYYPYKPLQYPHPAITGPTGGFQTNKVIAVANSRVSASPGTFTFSSVGSASLNGVALTYFWTFGDGGFSSEANPMHAYPSNGTYSAQLFVSDGLTTASAKLRVRIPSP